MQFVRTIGQSAIAIGKCGGQHCNLNQRGGSNTSDMEINLVKCHTKLLEKRKKESNIKKGEVQVN